MATSFRESFDPPSRSNPSERYSDRANLTMSHVVDVVVERASSSMLSPNPTVPPYTDDLQWVTAYLVAHMMSDNSRRYAYILWMCIGLIFFVGCLLRWVNYKGGYLGAKWSKWAIRRRTWRGKSFRQRSARSGKPGYPVSLPSNGQLLGLAALPIIVFLLSFLGPDYISPSVGVFDLRSTGLSARAYDVSWFVQFQPQYTINKNWWTSGGRTGIIAFALLPLCVLFALKAPPFAIFALPFTTQIHFDKLSWLHRWSARLIWFITLLHVVLWSVQLLLDRRESTGKIGYTYAWQYQKFIFGWIAFSLMTLLVFSSSRPLRKSHYETFYAFHVVLVPMTLIMSALHHPPLWVWCWIALGIWVGERAWRATWWLHINGFFGTEKSTGAAVIAPQAHHTTLATMQSPSPTFPPSSPYLDSRFSTHLDGSLLVPAAAITYSPPLGYCRAELLSGATLRYVTNRVLFAASRAIVFLVRSKKGWTRDLWDYVATLVGRGQNHDPDEKPPNGTVMPTTGVLLKMYVEGPFGSVVRTKWETYSTVVIFVAGSGVSFGLSILEYLCLCLAGRDGKYLGGRSGSWGTRSFMTRRVRFVWLMRDYAHVQWCASILRRCMNMIPSPGMDMDIFVTNFKPPVHRQPPARPPPPLDDDPTAADDDSASGSDTSDDDGLVDLSYYNGEFGDEEPDNAMPPSERENYILDLTNWEDDDNASLPGEDQLSHRIHREGKKLRRLTRLSMALSNRQSVAMSTRQLNHEHKVTRPSPLANMHTSQISTDDLLPYAVEGPSRLSMESDLGTKRESWQTASDAHLVSPRSSITITPTDESFPTHSQRFSNPPKHISNTPNHPSPLHTSRPSSHLTVDTAVDTRRRTPKSASSDKSFVPDRRSVNPLLHVESEEMRAVSAVSEKVRPGKPRLDRILHYEVERSRGPVLVACCGPSSFNAIVRKAVAGEMDPERARKDPVMANLTSVSRNIIKKVLAVETPETIFMYQKELGQATVTYMISGRSRHEDSAGHKGTIGVQWMIAGKGIIHAEMPVHEEGLPDPRGLQLWLDLPKQYKMVDPSYQELGPDKIPSAYPEGPEGPVTIKVISGKSHGVESPVRPLGGCWYFHVIFNKKSTVFQDLPVAWTSFIYIWKGSVIVGDNTMPVEAFHTIVLSADDAQTGVKLTATEDDTEFILVSGEPLDQTVFQYGPFVMTTKEEIQKTLLDYQFGRNGFEKAHTWQSEIAHQ
ncbi:hypothetical protein D9758_003291 [Tetrapyrgos nigripes]|uniref:FAD-binding FR-type domain-containing protein n=1 Tax=Tetrapyrgos nigripes TaxID=182062 RepID=A0A8H5LQK7_9AGAR|nr:hypothetical protein D9758_003291 [Tetrapyrgos nigripes]